MFTTIDDPLPHLIHLSIRAAADLFDDLEVLLRVAAPDDSQYATIRHDSQLGGGGVVSIQEDSGHFLEFVGGVFFVQQ